MKGIQLHKMHGCGNDFLILDAMNGSVPKIDTSLIPKVCERHFGVGADGIAVLSRQEGRDAKWTFYNCDGGEAEMCGNAARCVTLYLSEKYFSKQDWITIQSRVGPIRGRKVDTNLVEIGMPIKNGVSASFEEKLIKFESKALRIFFINTGVPHAVIEAEDIQSYPIEKVGKFLVKHPAFMPAGTNVTFFQKEHLDEIYCTTFERGVEEQTFACGTGVAAGTIVYSQLYAQKFPIKVHVPGGSLSVDKGEENSLLLRGEAKYIASVNIVSDFHGESEHKLFGRNQ